MIRARPGGGLMLHTLYYPHEMRADGEFVADRSLITDKALKLAKQFINQQRAPFDAAEMKDKLRERLSNLLMSRSLEAFPGGPDEPPRGPAPILSIEDVLRRSLDALPSTQVKKPAQRERTPPSPRKSRKPRRK